MYRLTGTMMIFALSAGFQSAYAAPPQDAPSVVVRFADLDLSRSEGVAVLYRRLNGAAKTVCAALDGSDLARHLSFDGCVQSALSTAVAKVGKPALTAYYESQAKVRKGTVRIARNQSGL